MITSALLGILYFFVNTLTYPLQVLADVSVGTGVSAAVAQGVAYMATLNAFFPMTALVQTIVVILAIETGIVVFKFSNFIRRLFWGS